MEKISTFGMILIFFGTPVTLYSFLILSNTPLTVFGLACAILGATIFLTPWTSVPEPPIKAMVEGSCINIESLLEEFDTKEKAIYLPPVLGRIFTYVSLTPNPDLSDLKNIKRTETRIITKTPNSSGLLLFPPGSELIKHAKISQDIGLEAALYHVLVDFIEAVESVQTLQENKKITILLENPKIETTFPRFKKTLGSLPTSIAGAVIAYSLNEPVKLSSEEKTEGEIKAQFELVEDEQE